MDTSHRIGSIHQANLLLSANVFAHFDEQARRTKAYGSPALNWHVIDHDDCRDRRFRQARLPRLTGSPHPKTVSLSLPSSRTMGSVGLSGEMKKSLINEIRGYAQSNQLQLQDISSWFGNTQSGRRICANSDAICDVISSSSTDALVDLNVSITALFARQWLDRDLTVIRSTDLFRESQPAVIAMLREVLEILSEHPGSPGDCPLRWEWWFLDKSGVRRRPDSAAVFTCGVVGTWPIVCRQSKAALEEIREGEIVIPGVLADNVADSVLRRLSFTTQYWRSKALVESASLIAEAISGTAPQAAFVGMPDSFALPSGAPPSSLSQAEANGLSSGIYSALLYWLIGSAPSSRSSPARPGEEHELTI